MVPSIDGGRKHAAKRLFAEGDVGAEAAAFAGDEETGAFVGDAELAQLRFAERRRFPRANDEARAARADAGDAQQLLEGCCAHFHGEEIEVVEGPVRLGVDREIKEGGSSRR